MGWLENKVLFHFLLFYAFNVYEDYIDMRGLASVSHQFVGLFQFVV